MSKKLIVGDTVLVLGLAFIFIVYVFFPENKEVFTVADRMLFTVGSVAVIAQFFWMLFDLFKHPNLKNKLMWLCGYVVFFYFSMWLVLFTISGYID